MYSFHLLFDTYQILVSVGLVYMDFLPFSSNHIYLHKVYSLEVYCSILAYYIVQAPGIMFILTVICKISQNRQYPGSSV